MNSEQRLPQSDMNSTSPLSSSLLASRRSELGGGNVTMYMDQALQQQISQLRQQQHLQHQLLLRQFQEKQQELAEEHQKQLQEMVEQKKKQDEEARAERERCENERLVALKNKEKSEQSAVASTAVKQKLQEFVLNKKSREAAANGITPSSPSASSAPYRAWTGAVPTMPAGGMGHKATPLQLPGPGPGMTISGSSATGMPYSLGGAPHPYRQPPLPGNYDDDFPLRKTVSEPNMKMRSKHRALDRRCGPLVKKRDIYGGRHIPPMVPPVHTSYIAASKRMSQLASETGGSTPDSGASSPLSTQTMTSSLSSTGAVPMSEQEASSSQYSHLLAGNGIQGSLSEFTLYTSLPNISLGRPALFNNAAESSHRLSESDMQQAASIAVRMGYHPLFPTVPIPYYPNPTLDTSEYGGSPDSSLLVHQQGDHPQKSYFGQQPITDAQVAQARLNKGIRPLGRTQSAPLPLDQIRQQTFLTAEQHDQSLRDRQLYDQGNRHILLNSKQQLRNTILQRGGSRSQVENVEEETEAAVAREMSRDRIAFPEVIDLTEHRVEEDLTRSRQYSSIAADDRDNPEGLPPVQHRLTGNRPLLPSSTGSAFSPRPHHIVRSLTRAFSSPLVSLNPAASSSDGPTQPVPLTLASAGWGTISRGGKPGPITTALAYDSLMLKHQCVCGDNRNHPEHGGRLQSIWARLQETELVHRCGRIHSRKATLEELQSVHPEAYTLIFGTRSELSPKIFTPLPCGGHGVDTDTSWNPEHTPPAARIAAGCVIDLAAKAVTGEIKNGFAVVRPPGHHAEAQQAMGFCFFNSVAIAAKQLRLKHKLDRILIVDWDVHHGNGTQQIFYDDPHVLYISIHRHDDGNFFPGTGNSSECGSEDGLGFTVNIPWSGGLNPPLGDAEYLAAFRTLVMPIAQDFDPQVVLVSAGFDAAAGHPPPLGGYQVSSACFGYLTRQLMTLAGGKVVMALEGGYDLPSICDATYECVRALLGDEPAQIRSEELSRRPCQNAIDTLHKCISVQLPHWPVIKRQAFLAGLSAYQSEEVGRDGNVTGNEDSETLTAMAGLSVCRTNSNKNIVASTSSQESSQEPMDQDESK